MINEQSQTGHGPTVERAGPLTRPVISGSGILIGSVFFAASLTPSLVPRDTLVQGLLGGAVFAVGYGLVIAALALWRWLELPEPPRRLTRPWTVATAVIGLGIAGLALSRADEWQNAVRAVMAMAPVESAHRMQVLAIATACAALVFTIAWIVRRFVRWLERGLNRVVPPRVAFIAGLGIAFAVFGGLVDGVLVRSVYDTLDASYARLNQMMESDRGRPTEPWRTGSEASLVSWASLGRAGRAFVDEVPTRAEISEFWSASAEQPLRVYVGLSAAGDAEARANLALAELQRVGAFERSVLVVAVPTGTGFMDNAAIATLEYLHRGHVATVAQQYSYLQSPFSLVFQPDYNFETARELLSVVYDHWTELADDARPKLVLHGLSLGTLGSERSVRLDKVVGDPFDGALWVGPPFLSPIHSGATAYRVPGSPEWLPRFEDGSFIRFMNQYSLTHADADWGPMRILYLQHASDPIVFFDASLFWQRPDWLRAPRAPDVADAMRWFPIVTGLQVAADMALSNAADVPYGYGHKYAASQYLDAWVEVTDPDVSAREVARLKAHFAD